MSTSKARQWPFVETPGEFSERLDHAIKNFGGDTLAAVRNVLIENPPTMAATSGATWQALGEPDPHGTRYNCERAMLVLGHYTDDEVANGAFLNYNMPLDVEAILQRKPGYYSPIMWMEAVKDRIRWLSRSLARATSLKGWPIRGVRVEGETVVITVKGGNDAARFLCGELVAYAEASAEQQAGATLNATDVRDTTLDTPLPVYYATVMDQGKTLADAPVSKQEAMRRMQARKNSP